LVTVGLTGAMVVPKPDVYKSSASFVVRPHELSGGDEIRAFDTLIRGVSINATYASIARSKLIRDRAKATLGPTFDATGLKISAEVVTGTNILSISVRGGDPQLVRDFAAAVATETVAYVDTVDDAYRLEPLDSPALPKRPLDNRKSLTIALGGVLGLLLGVWLALFVEYLCTPSPVAEVDEPPATRRYANAEDDNTVTQLRADRVRAASDADRRASVWHRSLFAQADEVERHGLIVPERDPVGDRYADRSTEPTATSQ
jgi:capsular polysaccharide biosynthesis protein